MAKSKRTEFIKEHAKKNGFENVVAMKSTSALSGNRGDCCSIGKDKDGYFAYTHRARSKSYPAKDKIPNSVLKFIGSTA